MMSDIPAKHLEMVRAVNEAKTEREHRESELRLEGFRECAKTSCCESYYCEMLVEADLYYLESGVDRPMCCGVWIDWKPAAPVEVVEVEADIYQEETP